MNTPTSTAGATAATTGDDTPHAAPAGLPATPATCPHDDTLILGLAAGYHAGDVRPFLASLRATGHAGRCVLFVSPTTRNTDIMSDMGAEIVPFERPAALAHLPYNALRYFLYLNLLRSAPRPFRRILITDVRDVIFQRDPFAFPWPDGLNVTLEDARMTIGACPYMTRWLTGHMGESAWRALATRRISCSGTTVGDHAAMTDYLERLVRLLLPFTPAPDAQGRTTGMAGYDQGVHNHLLHGGHLPSVSVHDNAGPILTLGYKETPPLADTDGHVLNDAGRPAVMVHQYDRMPDLFRTVRKRYA